MNATQVEIQRIQTRLQKLGRPRQATTPGMSANLDDHSDSAPVIDLPGSSRSMGQQSVNTAQQFTRKELSSDRQAAGSEDNSTGSANDDGYGFLAADKPNYEALLFSSSPKSSISHTVTTAQSRSVNLNEETIKVLSRSAEIPAGLAGRGLGNAPTQRIPADYETDSFSARHSRTSSDGSPSEFCKQPQGSMQQAIAPAAPNITSENSTPDLHQPSSFYRLPNGHAATETVPPPTAQKYSGNYAATPHPSDSLTDAFQRLNAQAHQINIISGSLKTALHDMGAIAQYAEHQRAIAAVTGQKTVWPDLNCSLVCDSQPLAIPYVEQGENGGFVVKTILIEDLTSQHHAENLAQHLRNKASRHSTRKAPHGIWASAIRWLAAQMTSSTPQSHLQPTLLETDVAARSDLQSALLTDSMPQVKSRAAKRSASPTLLSSMVWVGGSIFVRIGLDALLLSYPVLWPMAIALVVTPAAIAIYRTTVDPQSSFALGRRLLLIMIGLLLGGRL